MEARARMTDLEGLDVNNEYSGLLFRVKNGTQRRRKRRIPMDSSDLPSIIPIGSVCNVEEVRHWDLGFRDIVLVEDGEGLRLRRVLRVLEEHVFLTDETGEMVPELFSGTLLRVSEAWSGKKKLKLDVSVPTSFRLSWLKSLKPNRGNPDAEVDSP